MSDHARFNSTALALVIAVAASLTVAHAADMPIKAAPVAAPFLLVNDNSVSFTYFPGSTDPGVYGATYNARYQFEVTHFDVNRWGTNFIDFNFQQNGKKAPVQTMYGAQGSEEGDALIRNTLSGNAFFGKNFFSNSITKDVSLAYGGLFVVVDNFLAPQTHNIGVQFTLKLPGTVNLSSMPRRKPTTPPRMPSAPAARSEPPSTIRRSTAIRARPWVQPARTPATRPSNGHRVSNWWRWSR
jgi:hypothetical protein